MSKITPYFEIDGIRYEIKKTRWLVAEHNRLNETTPLSDEDKANTIKASNLVADVKKYAEKERECWENLCENPTEDNQRIYFMFKSMSDKAIADYNEFVSKNDSINTAAKHTMDILERVVIKALAEQYFNMDESRATLTWEAFANTLEDHNKIAEWLNAMAECLFIEEDEEEDNGFLSQIKKRNAERENNRKNGIHGKR